jgi:hypothetical protein
LALQAFYEALAHANYWDILVCDAGTRLLCSRVTVRISRFRGITDQLVLCRSVLLLGLCEVLFVLVLIRLLGLDDWLLVLGGRGLGILGGGGSCDVGHFR